MLSHHAGTSSLRKLNDLDVPQPIGHLFLPLRQWIAERTGAANRRSELY
jgi:hypothetical protein